MALAPGAPPGTPDVMENGKWVNAGPGYKAPPATLPKGNLWDQWQNQNPAGGVPAAAPLGAVWGGAPPMVSAPAAPAIPQAAIPTALNQVTNNRGFGGNDVDRTPYFAPFGMSTASAPPASGGVMGPGLMVPQTAPNAAIPKTLYSGDDPRYKGLDAKTASTWAGEDIRSADREARIKANYDSQVTRHSGDASAPAPSWVTPEWQASHPLGVGRIPGMPEDKPYDWNDPYAYKGDANTQFGFNSYTDRTPKDFAKLVKYFGSTEAAMKWLTPNH